jgi:hypothetical protein
MTNATATSVASKLARRVNFESKVRDMWLVLVEAGVAMFVLVFIVWWTMFAGRKQDGAREAPSSRHKVKGSAAPQSPPPTKDT